MITLLIRPGVLTKEYFADHRARYLPPVRVYLVLSVLFFAFGGLNAHRVRTLAPQSVAPAVSSGSNAADTAPPSAAAPAKSNKPPADDDADGGNDHDADNDLFVNLAFKDCNSLHSDVKWIEARLHEACLRHTLNSGAAVKAAFLANVPKMMFVFVPLAALTMLLLYWRPRRYYVEHLVFFLHNHAAMFMILLLQSAVAWAVVLSGRKSITAWVIAITACYAVWYVYRAMRVYYGQGRFKTIAKLFVVGFAYVLGLSTTLLITMLLILMFA